MQQLPWFHLFTTLLGEIPAFFNEIHIEIHELLMAKCSPGSCRVCVTVMKHMCALDSLPLGKLGSKVSVFNVSHQYACASEAL